MRSLSLFFCLLCSSIFALGQEENEPNLDDSLKLKQWLEMNSVEDIETFQLFGVEKNNFEKSVSTTEQLLDFQTKSLIQDPSENQPNKGRIIDQSLESLKIDPSELNPLLYRRLVTGPSQYDSRIELLELSILNDWERKILNNSRSVGMIVHRDQLWELTDSLYALDISLTLQKRLGVCPEEAYSNQLSVGVGTAFVIGEDSMMTANHVFEDNMEEYVVIFNFDAVNRTGAVNPVILAENIYEIEAIYSTDEVLDVAQFRVSRKLTVPVLKLNLTNTVKKDDMIYMIGHPSGLPKKVALNARVYTNNASDYFYSTLDAFQGNSGSPVFSISKNEVIGVLVSGEQDFYWSGNCNKSTLCELPYCQGEKVIRIERTINE